VKVFLVPIGPSRYLPYCEPVEAPSADDPENPRSFVDRLVSRYHQVIAAAEQSRLVQDERRQPESGWFGRMRGGALRWVADKIAEQRLLWQLRQCDEATLVYPSGLSGEQALERLRLELKRDGDRHLRWLVINALLLIASGVLAIVPGPNVIAYYFAFRVVGHYFAHRGARQGLLRVAWTLEESTALEDLRAALPLDPAARLKRVRDIATLLDLPHLVTFVERIALKGA
jgi:Mitochondrial K+-H+ exchange-related